MSNDSTTIPLEIAATFTAEPLERPLNHWFDQLGFNVATRFAPYNQVFQTLLDPNSPLRTNNSGLNVLLIRPEDWQRFGQTGSDEWRSELQRNATEFIEALQKITPTNPSRLLLILTPASPDTTSHPDSAKLLAEISQLIFSASQALGLTCLTPETLQQFYPVSDLHDPVADHEGHLPYSDEFFTALATAIARRLHANLLPPRKVIVLDADNTLWPGVAAEIGPENLEVTPPFQAFQKLLKTRRESGLLLALASKNEETDVHAAFQKATGMVLTEDDIVAWKVNWSPKSENITTLAGELNLGLDSFLFIDDNPVEIAQVNAALPSVLTLQIPSDPDQIPTFLDHLWLLDLSSKTTKEDRERTAMYQTMVARNQSRSQTSDFKTFLEQLELQVEFLPPSADIIPRLAQLSQRTNQFNTTTLRRSEDDFKQLILDDSQIIALKVSDRFGDYGLVGLVTAKATDTTLNIDSLLLSCRVLGKGVEQQLLAHLAELAQDLQIDSIDIDFIENERNTPAQNFLERIGKPHRTKTGFLLPVRVVQAAQKLEIIEETQVASPFTVVSSSLVAPAIYQAIATASSPAQILAHIRATAQPRPDLPETYAAPANETEKRIATLWQNILGIDRIGRHDKFSALGGKSLQVIQLLSALTCEFDAKLSAAELFENNTITAQAKLLNGSISSQPAPQNQESKDVPQDRPNSEPERGLQSAPEPKQKEREAPASHPINQNSSQDLAVVGMSCRLPESPNVHQFWQNLLDGKECLSQLTDEELLSAGVEPSSVRNDPSYLPVKGIMPDVENFDAAFFGIIPKEAKYMDPQQRVFLELTWECIEDAGYNPETYPGKIGLWAGNYLDTYVIANLVTDREFLKNWIPSIQVGSLQAELGNDKDYLATRVAFKLNLRGPAMTVQTACSTSLVAISQAAQALRSGSCDMAMAGGVTITLPEKKGYYYTPDGMLSGDGSCRAFDEKASGTVFSNGAGIVLLKRLEDAQRDGDHIHAVIKGYALNNDGGTKHSYTAPSIDGQAGVITDAIKDAQIDPSTITYVEAHGTGTPLGDPIEVAGLTKAYRALGVTHNQGCTLGTVKTNVGHLDVASGVTALIKTSFALEHGVIPPTLHFQNPNPKIDFENSPFQVRNELHQWNPDGHPRRAGISSFGVGGTNAHVILEEPPKVESSSSPRPFHLFPLSARSPEALTNAHQNLASYCADRALNPADVSHTLRIGRKHFNQRQILVSGDLANLQDAATVKGSPKQTDAPLVFMFPGQGSQTVGMGKDLYASEPVFRAELDRCSEILLPHLGEDLRHTLFPPADADQEAAATRIKQTIMAQPAIFVLSYCQAKLLIHWGLQPTALVGHSVGELVAATISGVVTLEDALEILANRGRLMQEVEPGGMLSVRLSEKELTPLIPEKLDLAAVNGPNLCVVAGPHDELEAFTKNLAEKNIAAKPLHTSHGFHSWMMNGVIEPFQKVIANAQLSAPQIPIRSTVTTEWLTDEQATDPHYWASHVRKTVRFTEAAAHFTETPETTLLEVGPGQTLSTLSRQVSQKGAKQAIFSSSGHATDTDSDALHFHLALGQLWLHGHTINWSAYDQDETRKRTPLPTYPFERKRFWIEPKPLDDISSSRVGNNADQATSPPQPTPQISQPTPQPEPTVTTPVSTDRKPAIQAELCNVLEELSGIEPEEMLADASLIELGFDSLMLTQVSKEIEKFFGVATTMRQLLGTLPTIGDIINHLDAEMPADKFAETASPQPDPAPPTATPVAQPLQAAPAMPAMPQIGAPPMVPGDQNSLMAQMMAMQMQQMQFMQQQMAAMAGIPQPAAPTPAAPPTPPAPQTPLTPLPSEPVKPTAKEETPPKPAGTPSGTSTNISRDFDESLSETQRQHLADLIARYTTKTKSSKEWTARYRKHYADPRTVSGFNRNWKEMIYQIVVEKSKGSRLLDLDGNEYVDILNGFGPGFFGHSPDFVLEAVKTQMDKGFEVGPQMMLAGETAEMFCELTGNERASFVCTGSEAVQGAMRIARTVTGRDKIAVFNKDYHGNFDEVLLRGGKSKGQPRTFPSAPGVPKQSVGNMLILDYGTDESLEILKAHAHELAAIMVEPVQSRWPEIQPCQFIHDLRKICDDSGSLFIMDEVICGLRDGPHGAQGFYKVKADLSTYGKVIGGGMPIGIVAGKAEYMDIFDGGQWQYGDDSFPETGVTFFAGTFVRHPLAIASAHAVLKHIKAQGPDLWKNLNARAERLYNTVNQFMVDNNVPVRVPGLHSRFFIRVNPEWKYGNLLFFHLREKGVFALEGFPSYLTTAHTDADIDYVINAFKESVLELQKGGFLEKTEALETLNGVRHQGPPPFLSALNPKPIASSPVPAKPQPEPSKPDLTPAPAPQRTTNLPLTEAQREIWLACQLGDDASCAFNEATSLSFKGNLDRAALSKALRSAVNHHDALRACFEEDGEQWEALHKVNIDIPFEDISKLPEAERFEALNRETALQAKTPFQLHQAPLVRAKLFQTENNSYVLFLTAHHIVADGWSFNVLIENLSDCYNAFVANTSPELEPSISFANYAIDRNKQEQSGEQSPHLSYWLGQFPDTVPMLNLPTDRPFPSHRTFEGSTVRQSIDGDLLKKLRRVGAKQGATLYATTLTAFEILLHRLTHQTDLVIGIPAAGQSSQGLDNMVGHCVNFLPLRTKVQPEQSFAEIVPQVAARVLEAYEHQDCTYGQLLPLLKLPRHPGRMPLVEIGFNLERMDYFKPFSGLETRFMDNPKSFVNQLLFFNLIESKDGLTLECHFNTHVLDPSTTQKWVAEYMQLLADIADKPNEPFTGPKETLTAAPGEPLPLSANNTTDYPRHATVQQLFEEIAAAHPGRPALQMRDWSMSYGQLNQHSNAVAAKLRGSGLAAGDPIPVLLDRSFDYIIAVLAVLKAGGAYVPIDPNYPQERIASLLYDLDFKHILTRSTFPERLPEEHRPGAIFVDQTVNCEEGERVNVPNLAPISNATDCAYMMFTSGSTGAAKGVQIPHRGIVRLVRNTNYATLDENETYLLASALSFDASTFEIWAPLLNGGKLVLLPPGPPSIDGIADAITHHGVTTMWLTSGLFQLMVEENLEALKPLRQLLAGGDVLSTYHVNKALHGLPNTRLINGYGPTENTTFTCCHTITTDDLNRSSIPIGRPISNTEVYLLDENQQPLPPEAEGELYLGGDGLALGYHNNPQLTDEKFVPNPFSAEPDSKLYRSGDRARYRADGTIEFIGRIDNEVKIRGFRIDPSEIETTLCNHVDVSQARVLAHGLTAADKSLVAYVATNNTSLSESELKSFIGTSLPDHLIPSLIIVLDKLPVTENGKIDDRALPAPGEKVTPLEGEIEYPQTETEHKMAAIWKAVLNLDVVPRNRSFFDLGGHSLQALKLFNRIHKEFGQKLPLSTLFEASTVEKLAARFAPVIEKEPSAQTPPFLVGLRKTGTKLPLFCIHGGDGGTLIYHNLSQGLTEDRPIYTLEAPALSGSGEVPETIEDTAAIYLKHIRTIQPEGPYLISGYCFGGIVAYEIAQQLRIRGEDIELLCLFDTDNPVEAPQYLTLAQRAATNWKSNEDLPVTKKLGKLGSRFGQGIVNKFKSKTEKAAAKVVTKSGFLEPDPTLQPVILREAHDKLMQAYQTKSFLGDLVLFTAEDQGDGVVYPPHLGWEGYIKGNLDLITIPGGHLTIFEQPHVQTLTTKLQEVLANRK